MPAAAATKVHRGERRRQQTHARLLEAARRVVARKGIEAATIADITEAADVGLGTFYHHFDSKEALLEPVIGAISEEIGAALDAASRDMTDPAEVLATAVRYMVRHVDDDPAWGWFVVRVISLAQVPDAFRRRSLRDLQRGVDAGRFVIDDLTTTLAALCGSVVWVMQARLTGLAPEHADVPLAAAVLRMVGVPARDAAEVAARPMPTIPVPDDTTLGPSQEKRS